MRIILTGAQGTGKTTVLNLLKDKYPPITNVCRTLAKGGVKLNEMGDTKSQALIFDTYTRLLKQENYVSDRGLTDVFGYSAWLCKNGKITREELLREEQLLRGFVENYPAIYFYFPIEFPVINDGVRSIDEEFRKEIDNNIRGNLLSYVEHFFTVSGSVEERTKCIRDVLKYYSISNYKL